MTEHRLFVVGPRDKSLPMGIVVNTTSRSVDFGRAFSPFLNQGLIEVEGLVAQNVENLWQFTKVYQEHIDKINHPDNLENPGTAWSRWRDAGLASFTAHRYPMGRGRKPEFSLLNGTRLGYVEARKAIYVPAYWQKLERHCTREVNSLIDMLTVTDVSLWDFDGYMTDEPMTKILNDARNKMGHAFVLKKFVYEKLGRSF